MSSKSAELAVKNNVPDPALCDREAWIDEIWPGAKVGEGWGGFPPHTHPLLSAFGLPDSWGASPPTPPLMSAFGLRVDRAHSGQGLGGNVLLRNWIEVKDEEAFGPPPEAEFRCGSIWIGLRPQKSHIRSIFKEKVELAIF